jgi:hypothetical protein
LKAADLWKETADLFEDSGPLEWNQRTSGFSGPLDFSGPLERISARQHDSGPSEARRLTRCYQGEFRDKTLGYYYCISYKDIAVTLMNN